MGSGKKTFTVIHDEMTDALGYFHSKGIIKPKKIDPLISRTYMPGYDMGDWLTLKASNEIYEIIQVTEITNEPPYGAFYRDDRTDLYIVFKRVEIKEHPKSLNTQQARDFLRWKLKDNHISYAEFLKEYRPLTDTEKLLYAKED